MESAYLQKVVDAIREKHPNLEYFEPERMAIFDDQFLGGGGFCDCYRATVDGFDAPVVCAKIIKCKKKADVMDELAVIPKTKSHILGAYGYSSHQGADGAHRIVLITPICEHGDLDDLQDNEKNELTLRVKVSIMKDVLKGLEELKKQRIVWRDLKGQNILIKKVERGPDNEVTSMSVMLSDWGCAAEMPKSSQPKRRMTLYGPGTGGFIAPDTSKPTYDYQVDMWAFLVWAATLCLEPKKLKGDPLEDRIENLTLEKKTLSHDKAQAQIDEVLASAEGAVLAEMRPLWELLRSTAWADPEKRWTPPRAREVLKQWYKQLKERGAAAEAEAVVSPRVKANKKEGAQWERAQGMVSPLPAHRVTLRSPGATRAEQRARRMEAEVLGEVNPNVYSPAPAPAPGGARRGGAAAKAGGGGGKGQGRGGGEGGGEAAAPPADRKRTAAKAGHRRIGEDGQYETCGKCNKRGRLLLCDGCPEAMHIACAGLAKSPKGDWFCPINCAPCRAPGGENQDPAAARAGRRRVAA